MSDITKEINSVETKSEKRMTVLEKQLSLNNRKLDNDVISIKMIMIIKIKVMLTFKMMTTIITIIEIIKSITTILM